MFLGFKTINGSVLWRLVSRPQVRHASGDMAPDGDTTTVAKPRYVLYTPYIVKLSLLTTTHFTGMLSHANPVLNSTVELPDEL